MGSRICLDPPETKPTWREEENSTYKPTVIKPRLSLLMRLNLSRTVTLGVLLPLIRSRTNTRRVLQRGGSTFFLFSFGWRKSGHSLSVLCVSPVREWSISSLKVILIHWSSIIILLLLFPFGSLLLLLFIPPACFYCFFSSPPSCHVSYCLPSLSCCLLLFVPDPNGHGETCLHAYINTNDVNLMQWKIL